MSNYTYNDTDTSNKLESFEWDNVWWEQTEDSHTDRILYIGDSISCAVRKLATQLSDGKYLFDGFGTSKAIDNPYYLQSLELFTTQQGKRALTLFNNGLHGWHLSDTEYDRYYTELLGELIERYGKTAVVLTTDVINNSNRSERIAVRNSIAYKAAEITGCKVIDLYTFSIDIADYHTPDGVHFNPDGNTLLANKLIESINSILAK